MAATEDGAVGTQVGSAGSVARGRADLAGLPLLAVSAAFFAAATVVAGRGGSTSAGLPLWFPLAVCGGISVAGAGALLLFSGGDATPVAAAPAVARAPAVDQPRDADASEGRSPDRGPPSVTTPGWERQERPAAGAGPADPLLLSGDRSDALAEASLLSGEPALDASDGPEDRTPGSHSAAAIGPGSLDLGETEVRGAPELPALPTQSGSTGAAVARRTPADPVHMNLGEFVQALQAKVTPARSGGSAAAIPSVASASGTIVSPGVPGATSRPADLSHPRCAECGTPVPAYPSPGRCPACGRPMCGSCQVASVHSGAFGRCRECRGVPAPVATPA